MSLLIGFLTFILVLACLLLILLVLIQLPKKEAGAGVAFGGGATDALFGAGSGNALTKITKYTGTAFVVLAVVISVLQVRNASSGSRNIEQELQKRATTPAAAVPAVPQQNILTQQVQQPATGLQSTETPLTLPPATSAPANPAPGQ